jgi:hypothetical protein
MTVPYVHSKYPRKPDDNYQTVDPRCVDGFVNFSHPAGMCIDVCAPNGSGIVDRLIELGFDAMGIGDAFMDNIEAEWIITNPPYTRGLVDKILERQIARAANMEVVGIAALLRTNFDHAQTRANLFGHNPRYWGQIKLCFRPWWFEKKSGDHNPIHNYVWHIWVSGMISDAPFTRYYYPPKEEK